MADDDLGLKKLFLFYIENYDANARKLKDFGLMDIQLRCNDLFGKDYDYDIVENHEGECCATYPLELVILKGEKNGSKNVGSKNKEEEESKKRKQGQNLRKKFLAGKFARVRARFPAPVILFRGKNICRSSTLSQKVEFYMQAAHNQIANMSNMRNYVEDLPAASLSDMALLRSADIELINELGVKYIVDLMVENKKKKFGIKICSSEKVDMYGRYSDFVLTALPYPGVEFFREFNENNRRAEQIFFDWAQTEDAAALNVTHQPLITSINDPWTEYKNWDLVALTQNYFKLMLHAVNDAEPNTGLLVHCISGWDRTPLFVSLLRISLWADGLIHKSLTPKEMLFLTVGYDWLLFRHQLVNRTSRGENICYFCFYFLAHITGKEFSLNNRTNSITGPGAEPRATAERPATKVFKPTPQSKPPPMDDAIACCSNLTYRSSSSQDDDDDGDEDEEDEFYDCSSSFTSSQPLSIEPKDQGFHSHPSSWNSDGWQIIDDHSPASSEGKSPNKAVHMDEEEEEEEEERKEGHTKKKSGTFDAMFTIDDYDPHDERNSNNNNADTKLASDEVTPNPAKTQTTSPFEELHATYQREERLMLLQQLFMENYHSCIDPKCGTWWWGWDLSVIHDNLKQVQLF